MLLPHAAARGLALATLVALIVAIFFVRSGALHADVVLLVLAGLVVLTATAAHGRPRWRAASRHWPYLAYFAAITLSAVAAWSPDAWSEYLRQVLFLAVVFGVARTASGRSAPVVLVALLLVAAFAVVTWAVLSVVHLQELERPVLYDAVQQWSGYPELGLLAGLGAGGTVGLLALGSGFRLRLASGVLASGFVASAMLLYSRSAWITIAIVTLWLAAVAAVRWRRWAGATMLLAGSLAALIITLSSPLVAEYATTLVHFAGRGETIERMAGWRAAADMLRDHPWLGVGPGGYPAAYPDPESRDRLHAYNIVFHTAAEIGLIGALAYLAMWARVLVLGISRARPGISGSVAFALHGMLVAFFVRSQSEHFLANLDPSFRLLLLLAVMFGLTEAAAAPASRAAPISRGVRGEEIART